MSRLFDGVNDQIGAAIAPIADDSDWTMACWVRPTSAGESDQGYIIAAFSSNDVPAHFVRFNGATLTVLAAQVYSSTVATSVSIETLATSAWSLLVATHRASDNITRIYIGTLSAAVVECTYSTQSTGVGTWAGGGDELLLGCRDSTDRTFDGRIGPSCFDNREWTVPEMENFRSGLFPAPRSTVKGFWPLMSPNVAQGEDLSGNGYHLTVIGATVAENPPVAFRWGDAIPVAVGPTAAVAELPEHHFPRGVARGLIRGVA